jgi:uncharacterized damage-inducible protein DinB
MAMKELLLSEFDAEIKKTRAMLECVPMLPEYLPHERSMKLGRLAAHTAELAGFGVAVLTTPALDFGDGSYKPAQLESKEQLLALLDSGAAKARAALVALPDAAWEDNWKLGYKGRTIFDGTRFLAYRQMFLNHLVHHRAQIGVYLRLNNVPIPGTYGPSADDQMGGGNK